jgi:hydroxymethylpyrimidine pyrophosphatase-like HAD family hydrolase
MCELLGIDPRRSIAVGDYDNDVSMIKAAGLGIAVANAMPSVMAVADAVTVSNEEHAIARIIYDLDSGKLTV